MSEGTAKTTPSWLDMLSRAAQELMPVVVDLGPEQARLDAYLDRLGRDESGPYLRLAPIAAPALTSVHGRVRVRPAVDGIGWELHARRIVALGSAAAAVELTGARVEDAARGETSSMVHNDALVIVVPGGLDDALSYVFPICRIGMDLCEIRAATALTPGTRLDCVEIVGDRRVLRRASAEVLETVPWYLAAGAACFRSRLALGPVSGAPDRSYDLVTEPAEVRRLLTFAGTTMASGSFEAPGWGRGALRILHVDRDEATVELSPAPHGAELPPASIRIVTELLAVQYEMEVRVLSRDGGRARTTLPLILRRRRRHRLAHRILVPETERIEVTFLNPVTGSTEVRRVTELSYHSIRFDAAPLGSVLWEGLPLERASLVWNDLVIPLGDLEVREIRSDVESIGCIASIRDARVVDDPDMIELLASLAHPHVHVHDGASFDALHATYVRAELFGPHMHRNLDPMVEHTRGVWRTLHAAGRRVARTFVHGPRDRPDAAVTVLRAWEHTWVAQHFVDVSPRFDGATGKLQTAYLDHLVPRTDGRYLVFFVKEDNHVMNGYLRRFFAGIGTPEAASRNLVELWSHAGGRRADVSVDPCFDVVDACAEDELAVARAAERALGPDGARAVGMRCGEIDLPVTRAAFREIGLVRERDCRIVRANGERAWALLEERATPGLNLTWMLNATWVVPMHADADPERRALRAGLAHVLDRPAQAPSGERFLNVVGDVDPDVLREAGFHKEAGVYLYVLSRAGVHRFLEYAVDRYGELDAAVRRRAEVSGRGRATDPGGPGEASERELR